MKILFVDLYADASHGGGAEVVLWEQMRGLKAAGHDPVLLGTSPNRGLRTVRREGLQVWEAGIRNIYWPGDQERPGWLRRALWHSVDSYNPLMQGYVKRILATERPDVVCVHDQAGWSVALYRTIHRAGIPIVQVLHGSYLMCPRATMFRDGRNCERQCTACRLLRIPHRQLSRHVSAVVGVSRYVLEKHLDHNYFTGVPFQRVIHNGRNAVYLGIDGRSGTVSTHRCVRVGFIGRLETSKGVERLLEVFKALTLGETELWIAGTGKSDYELELRKHADSDRIRFLGRVSPENFYPHIDILVVPSLSNDTLPTVVIEAFAFGKPVIGARRGGIPEMIKDQVNGILVEPDSPVELGDAIRRLSQDQRFRARLALAAKASGSLFIDVRGWVSEYARLFEDVVDYRNASRELVHGPVGERESRTDEQVATGSNRYIVEQGIVRGDSRQPGREGES